MCKGGWLRGSADWGIVPLARQVGLHHEVTIPQSVSLTAPFTQGSLLRFYTIKKPGRTFLFAPAVLLLWSHSLITLTRYFSDCTLVFIRIILTLRFCLTLSGSQFTCSLVLPSGSLFAEKHLWNVVKSVRLLRSFLGYWGLMLRTAPLNSSTLECLLVDQMKFRFFLFGGVVTVIATDLLSS